MKKMANPNNFKFQTIFEFTFNYWKGSQYREGKAKVTTGSNQPNNAMTPSDNMMFNAAKKAGYKNIIKDSIRCNYESAYESFH